jgi:hypothetical protein
MTTIYYIQHNDQYIDQDSSMDALYPRLQALAEANPNNHYSIIIDGPGKPLTPYEGPADPISTGTQTI